MSLLDYIKGNRRGKAAHRLERESMRDPFLSEAIEGYHSVTNDHIAGIEDIQKRIRLKSQNQVPRKQKKHSLIWTLAAACSAGVLALAGYFLFDNPQTVSYSQKVETSPPAEVIDIYVPSAFYESNEAIIENQNHILYEEESLQLSIQEEEGPISIYVPGEYYEENKETIQKIEEILPN